MNIKSFLGLRKRRDFSSEPVVRSGAEHAQGDSHLPKGQTLVETAIILPILLLMLLGVLEVGWALRGYLVLVNVNREATRFAARGVYLNLDEKNDITQVGYEKVVSHTLDSLSTQLALDFSSLNPNASMIVTYYKVEPRDFTCPDDPPGANTPNACAKFDCSRFAYENINEPDFVSGEDLNDIEYPLLVDTFNDPQNPPPSYYGQVLNITNTTPVTTYYYHIGRPIFSRINPADEVVELRSQNNQINCERTKKNLLPTNNNVIIAENVYFQDQLLGLPFVTAFVPDPVPFYTHTAMRLTSNIRETAQDDIAACELRPIIIPTSLVGALDQGEEVTIQLQNSPQTPGNFSFLHWDSTENASNTTLGNEIEDGTLVENYKEPGDTSDVLINVGDWVESSTGTNVSSDVKNTIDALIGQEILLPVWNDNGCPANCEGQGVGGQFRVMTFIVMKITGEHLTGGTKTITFEFSRFAPEACPGDDPP